MQSFLAQGRCHTVTDVYTKLYSPIQMFFFQLEGCLHPSKYKLHRSFNHNGTRCQFGVTFQKFNQHLLFKCQRKEMLFWLPRSLSQCCEWPLLETQPSLPAVFSFNSPTCPVYVYLVHLKRWLCSLPVISIITEHVHLLNVCVELFLILQPKKKVF